LRQTGKSTSRTILEKKEEEMGGVMPKELSVTITNAHEVEIVGISSLFNEAMGDVPFKLRGNELRLEILAYRPYMALTIYYFHKEKNDYLHKLLYIKRETLDEERNSHELFKRNQDKTFSL